MWNKKEMSKLDATLTKVPLALTLTFDLEISISNCIWAMGLQGQIGIFLYLSQNGAIATKQKANMSIER